MLGPPGGGPECERRVRLDTSDLRAATVTVRSVAQLVLTVVLRVNLSVDTISSHTSSSASVSAPRGEPIGISCKVQYGRAAGERSGSRHRDVPDRPLARRREGAASELARDARLSLAPHSRHTRTHRIGIHAFTHRDGRCSVGGTTARDHTTLMTCQHTTHSAVLHEDRQGSVTTRQPHTRTSPTRSRSTHTLAPPRQCSCDEHIPTRQAQRSARLSA